MGQTLLWQLYVSTYTLLVGLPLLTAPELALPIMGFPPVEGPWVRLAGMFLLSLSYISFGVYREKAVAVLPYSIRVRAAIVLVLLGLALAGHPPFLYLMALVVGVGVAGSIRAYRKERECDPHQAAARAVVEKTRS